MRVRVRGKNLMLTDFIERYAAEKFLRLAHFDPAIDRIELELSQQATRDVQNHFTAEANVIAEGKLVLRGEEHAADLRVAIDALVEMLENSIRRHHERERSLHREFTHGNLPPTPIEAVDGKSSTLAEVLDDYGVDEETIARLQERGIQTMEQLRAVVEDGRLGAWLGPGFERKARKLDRVIEQLRM